MFRLIGFLPFLGYIGLFWVLFWLVSNTSYLHVLENNQPYRAVISSSCGKLTTNIYGWGANEALMVGCIYTCIYMYIDVYIHVYIQREKNKKKTDLPWYRTFDSTEKLIFRAPYWVWSKQRVFNNWAPQWADVRSDPLTNYCLILPQSLTLYNFLPKKYI